MEGKSLTAVAEQKRRASSWSQQNQQSVVTYREASRQSRDIWPLPQFGEPPEGEPPHVVGWDDRNGCRSDLRLFLKTYFPSVFELQWSRDQIEATDTVQRVVLNGGSHALAMPRGSGKSAIAVGTVIWCLCYGHKSYIYLIQDDAGSAKESLQDIRTELFNNDLLYRDFPEICYPVRKCEGKQASARGQIYRGQPSHLLWGTEDVDTCCVFLTEKEYQYYSDNGCGDDFIQLTKNPIKVKEGVPQELQSGVKWYMPRSAGCLVRVKGIGGGIRGAKHKHPLTGRQLRPDFAILDDVQTDKTAASPESCRKMILQIDGAIDGLAGPGKSISIFMPCTVIRPDDVSDTYLNPQEKPEFNGRRCSMVIEWPEGVTDEVIDPEKGAGRHWHQYAELRRKSLREHGDISLATAYYKKHRKVMDKGFVVSWDERYLSDPKLGGNVELSAQQHAMNLRLKNRLTFFAEYQNQPISETIEGTTKASPEDVLSKVTPGLKKGQIPINSRWVTAFIDVSDEILWYAIAAVESDFTGYLIDWGTWPATPYSYPTKAQANKSMFLSEAFFKEYPAERQGRKKQKAPFEAKIYFGLESLLNIINGYEFIRDDDAPIDIYGAIDANWGQSTETVRRVIKETNSRNWLPSHGRGITAVNKPMSDYKIKAGGFAGEEWTVSVGENSGCWQLTYDTNYWKTFTHTRILTPQGSSGSLSVCDASAEDHELLSRHIGGSEYPTVMTAKGRSCDVWEPFPNDPDNDLLDCSVGCLVLASTRGAKLKTVEDETQKVGTKKPSMREMWQRRRG